MYKGCTSCPYVGRIELRECPDAYTEAASGCGLFDRSEIPDSMPQAEFEAKLKEAENDPEYYHARVEEV